MSTAAKTNPIVYVVCVIVAFVAIFYGTRAFADYNMMKRATDKVAFLEQNKASQDEICSALRHALDISKTLQKQKQFEQLTARIESSC